MTCVSGHLTSTDFGPEAKNWDHTPPERLFDAPVHTSVDQVRPCPAPLMISTLSNIPFSHRTSLLLPQTLRPRQEGPEPFSSGLIVIEKASTLAAR